MARLCRRGPRPGRTVPRGKKCPRTAPGGRSDTCVAAPQGSGDRYCKRRERWPGRGGRDFAHELRAIVSRPKVQLWRRPGGGLMDASMIAVEKLRKEYGTSRGPVL